LGGAAQWAALAKHRGEAARKSIARFLPIARLRGDGECC
jgi:hypothetical protein